MNTRHFRRLIFVMLLIAAAFVIVSLVLLALKQNMNLYYTPEEVMQGKAPLNTRLRVGGMVLKNTVVRAEGLNVRFQVTDYVETLQVQYNGILPDLFREGKGMVAVGKLISKKEFVAEEVLAKHDENYMPPEVAKALQKKR